MSSPNLCIKPTSLPLPSLVLTLTILSLQLQPLFALSSDGIHLLSFKYSILSDPLNLLQSWNFLDQFPCSWVGITCSGDSRVVGLSLPNSRLLGSIPSGLGLIDTLRHVDLSGNFLNGTIPATLLNGLALQALSLSSNAISGDLPGVYSCSSLSYLNLSDNAIGGQLPANFSSLFKNLTVLSLRGNYFSGEVPSGFESIEVLDLSANLFNGSFPSDLGGSGLRYLNLSYNKISGGIPAEFAAGVPENATVDLSFNNLTGQIPKALEGQDLKLFSGNLDLCGKPLKNLCIIPSTLSTPPNVTSTISPAIAVIPKSLDSSSDTSSDSSSGGAPSSHANNGIKPATIVGITSADLAGLVILGAIFFYLYRLKHKKNQQQQQQQRKPEIKTGHPPEKKTQMLSKDDLMVQINASNEPAPKMHSKCLTKCLRGHESEEGASSDARTSSEGETSDIEGEEKEKRANDGGVGELVMVDGETELEVETLLKASAYILGASGSTIVYKAVLQNGTTFAVRRLGESGVEKLKDFEGQVRTIAKLRHPNLVRVRGFYWGSDEKLVICDYVSNGSLATYRKNGPTRYDQPLLARLKIARGLARGLAYIHEKRFVHGNIKPSNILLTPDMEPIISDLGLIWLVHGTNVGGSGRQFGSKRSHDGAQETSVSGSPYISPFSYRNGCASPYQAPESLRNIKPSPKWDVYSFGIVLLELLTGKVYLEKELGQWTPGIGLEDRYWVLKMADVGLRAEIQGREEVMMGVFKLGFSCASLVPHKRPSMKEALQVLDKIVH